MSLLSLSDAGSSGSVSAAVGAPSEDRIRNLFTLVKDGQGKVIQKNNRKARVCNACHLQDNYSLDKAVKHLENCEQAQAENEKLTQLLDEVHVDRDGGSTCQGTLDGRVVSATVTDSEQSTIDMAILLMFIMCNISFNVADSPWYKRIFRYLHPGFTPATAKVLRTKYLTGAFASARQSIKKLVAAVTMPHCITLVLDGWSDINME
ncbi:hypothetical protein ABBQ32_004025 [Trebouxia sp. C0010 RCD-2024]